MSRYKCRLLPSRQIIRLKCFSQLHTFYKQVALSQLLPFQARKKIKMSQGTVAKSHLSMLSKVGIKNSKLEICAREFSPIRYNFIARMHLSVLHVNIITIRIIQTYSCVCIVVNERKNLARVTHNRASIVGGFVRSFLSHNMQMHLCNSDCNPRCRACLISKRRGHVEQTLKGLSSPVSPLGYFVINRALSFRIRKLKKNIFCNKFCYFYIIF